MLSSLHFCLKDLHNACSERPCFPPLGDANSAVKILSLVAWDHAQIKYQDGRCGEARAISRRVAMKDCSHDHSVLVRKIGVVCFLQFFL